MRPSCETCEVLLGAPQRRERRSARLVRKRDRHLRPAGERLEQRPFGAGEVLEAVGEHGLAVPGVEIRLQALGRVAAEEVAVPAVQPVELGAVGGIEHGEVAVELLGVEEPGLELAQRLLERVGEAAEARGGGEPVELRAREHAADEERALRPRHEPARASALVRHPLEDVVERPDRAREQGGASREEVALRALDVRPVRHDEHRLPLERGEIAVEQRPDLARVRRPSDEAERHRPILEAASDGSWAASAAEADFGLRPRRATARPGIEAEQSSQRSACFDPRRASVNVIRSIAPFPSSTSLPQLSQTRTVFRAMDLNLDEIQMEMSGG